MGSAFCCVSADGPSAGLNASACSADTGCEFSAGSRVVATAADSSALSRSATAAGTAPEATTGTEEGSGAGVAPESCCWLGVLVLGTTVLAVGADALPAFVADGGSPAAADA